jgi:hypothetical protein
MVAPTRKYQLVKVGPGDWLLPGNDASHLWRVSRGESQQLAADGVTEKTVVEWEVWSWNDRLDRDGALDGLADLDWSEWSDWEFQESAGSRADGVLRALELEARPA